MSGVEESISQRQADARAGGRVFALAAEAASDFRQMKLCQTA